MAQMEEEKFIAGAFEALIDRGVAKKTMLSPSTVTDADINKFEKKFGIELPSIFRTYLKAYCYEFTVICAPVPVDGIENDRPGSEKGLWWIELLSLPKEEPLRNLYALMESFRRICTDSGLVNLELDKIKQFVPIGEWDGPLCIDLGQTKACVQNPDTWQICSFDQTVFDWKKAGYLDENGIVKGEKKFPDFKTLLELYFYGKYDKEYEQQLNCRITIPIYKKDGNSLAKAKLLLSFLDVEKFSL